MLHELIDRDEPKCLYCNSEVDLNIKSQWQPFSPYLKADQEILTCRQCKEVFEINSLQTSDNDTEYVGFIFTCKNYRIFCNYIESYFDISDSTGKHISAIPFFTIDFSDKNKLYNKLKSYILFS